MDGQTGSLCDPNKPDQLQEKLKELIEQPERGENWEKQVLNGHLNTVGKDGQKTIQLV